MNAAVRRTLTLAVLAGGALVGLNGCQQYSTYPNIPTARGMAEDPNNPAALAAMVRAIQYVATRYSPGSPVTPVDDLKSASETRVLYPIVINLPRGMRQSYYARAAQQVGPDVVPMSADVDPSLPVFHIGRVWLRFNSGTVDVYRPMPELGTQGERVYQVVTVRLEGGFEPWHVVHARGYTAAATDVPKPYSIPNVERVDQYEYTMKLDRGEIVEAERGEAAETTPSESYASPDDDPLPPAKPY